MINLLASAIFGAALWVVSWLGRRRRIERMRAFFGVRPGTRALFVVAKHFSSPEALSVHREDTAAVVELAAMVMACGGRSDLVGYDQVPASLGAVPELCVGGPSSSSRSAAHLRLLVPGVTFESAGQRGFVLRIGDAVYRWKSDHPDDAGDDLTYAVVIKTYGSPPAAPVFLVCGMTASSNRAAAHHLTTNHRDLARVHGTHGRFALLLTLRGLSAYGSDALVEAEDVTGDAFAEPVRSAP